MALSHLKKSFCLKNAPFFVRLALFVAFLLLLCTIFRSFLVYHYLPLELHKLPDFHAMWLMGMRFDMRSIGIGALIALALIYVYWIAYFLAHKLLRWCILRLLQGFFYMINRAYIFMLGFVFFAFAFVNFYYFGAFGSKIDVFIFGLRDDDTNAVLEILWHNYPVMKGLFLASTGGGITYICFKFLHLDSLPHSPRYTHLIWIVFSHFVLIVALLIAARGSLGTFPLREDNHHFFRQNLFLITSLQTRLYRFLGLMPMIKQKRQSRILIKI